MLDETRLEFLVISASQIATNALIETQTILQLMVKKGIVTPEEVAETREIVKNQPKYKEMLREFHNAMDRVDDSMKFQELLEKSLKPNGNENLTNEERNYLLDKINGGIKEI